jgi:hypothetical protein
MGTTYINETLYVNGVTTFDDYVKFKTDVWNISDEGNNRFYFAASGRTYFGSINGYEWRNSADSAVLTVIDSGNVGIGTTSPSTKLQVSEVGSNFFVGNAFAKVENTSGASSIFYLADTTDSAALKNIGSSLAFINSSTEGMRLTTTGLGIGTTSPSEKLDVSVVRSYGQSANIGIAVGGTDNGYVDNGTTSAWRQYVSGDSNGQALKFDGFLRGTGWTERMRITSGGNVGIGTTNPNGKLEVVDNLNSGTYGAVNITNNVSNVSYGHGLIVSVPNFSTGWGGNTNYSLAKFTDAGGDAAWIGGAQSYFRGNIGIGTTNFDLYGFGNFGGGSISQKSIIFGGNSYIGNQLGTDIAAINFGVNNALTSPDIINRIVSVVTSTTNNSESGYLSFFTKSGAISTASEERMRITSGGNVGIDTVSPAARLHVTAPGALSTDIAFKVRNSANTADLLSVAGNGSTVVSSLTATSGIAISQPAGFYYPSIGFYNNGGAFQGNITGYNSKLLTTTVLVQSGYSLGVGFGAFDSIYAQSQVLASSALSTDNSFAVVNNPKTGYHLKVNNAGNVQTGVGGLSIPRTDTPNGTNNATITHQTNGLVRIDKSLEVSGVYGRSGFDTSQVALDLGYYSSTIRNYGSATNTGFTFNTIVATTGTYFMRMQNGATDLFTILTGGSIGISNSAPKYKLDVSGSARISGETNTSISSSLVVYGSGSAQPVFTVQGSQGELFSVTDSLSGSLFSVNDISGLPIMEVFSDNTTLMGSYQDPMLITTTKLVTTASGAFTLYSLPTASYDTAFFEYSIRSGSNARAGTIMAVQLGSTVNFTETTTTDFGSTSGFGLIVQVAGANMILTGSATTAGWTIKTIVRGI